jgi:hypothetical protein
MLPLPGTPTLALRDENTPAAEVALSADQVAALTAVGS